MDSKLNRELEELFETLMENYVNNWYHENISEDYSFLAEIRHLIRYSSARIVTLVQQMDLEGLFTEQLLPTIMAHSGRVCRLLHEICQGKFDHLNLQSNYLIESKVLEKWQDPHWASQSAENQLNYLRAFADLLVCRLVDDIRIGGCFVDEELQRICSLEGSGPSLSKWSCQSSRHFLRELLLFAVLRPLVDFASDPDSLNRLALILLDDSETQSEISNIQNSSLLPTQKEQFLTKFADSTYNIAPDSLLAIKLSDLVRDPYLTKLLEIYLRDLNGPIKYLDCFLQARDIHQHILKLNSGSFGHSTFKRDQIASEIRSDIWLLFSSFVHQNSQNRISFPEKLVEEFSSVIEWKGEGEEPEQMKTMERVIESVYQEVYHYLQYNFVVPFCESENYLGFLCGAPPDVDDLIRGSSDESTLSRARKLPDASFSLSQFRKKLFNFITPTKDSSAPNPPSFYSSLSTSDLRGFDPEGMYSATLLAEELDSGSGNIVMNDLRRDLNRWNLSIEAVDQRRVDSHNNYLVFVIFVERNDLPDDCFANADNDFEEGAPLDADFEGKSLKHWTVGHKCEEFYALEDKLKAFYGNALKSGVLPERRTTIQLLRSGRNGRALMETHRLQFERFIQQLMQQPCLRHSDLLYTFLTCEEDSNGIFELYEATEVGNFLPDLNPLRAMRKVARERGQNLKPFILNVLANILAPPLPASSQYRQPNCPSQSPAVGGELRRTGLTAFGNHFYIDNEDRRSLSSTSSLQQRRRASIPRNMEAGNHNSMELNLQETQEQHENMEIFWKNSFYDMILFLLASLRPIRIPVWIESLFCYFRSSFGHFVSLFLRRHSEKALQKHLFTLDMATHLVRTLHEFVLLSTVSHSSSLNATPSQASLASSSPIPSNYGAAVRRVQQQRIVGRQQSNCQPAAVGGGGGGVIPPAPVTDQERQLRAELLMRCLEKRVEELLPCSQLFKWLNTQPGQSMRENSIDTALRYVFQCFQMPALNRQLAFVLLDIIVQKVLIDNKS